MFNTDYWVDVSEWTKNWIPDVGEFLTAHVIDKPEPSPQKAEVARKSVLNTLRSTEKDLSDEVFKLVIVTMHALQRRDYPEHARVLMQIYTEKDFLDVQIICKVYLEEKMTDVDYDNISQEEVEQQLRAEGYDPALVGKYNQLVAEHAILKRKFECEIQRLKNELNVRVCTSLADKTDQAISNSIMLEAEPHWDWGFTASIVGAGLVGFVLGVLAMYLW